MLLKKYTVQIGALLTPKYREIPITNITNAKGVRTINVSSIIVPVTLENGETHNFQGDETSQNRLARAGWAIDKKNIPYIPWRTYDNEIVNITVSDIADILLAAGQVQTNLWFNES